MPEGPEIRRTADALAEVLVGRPLIAATLVPARLRPYRNVLPGSSVGSVEARGKALLIRFDNGLSLYSHNQLYGVWRIEQLGAPPDSRRLLRAALDTEHASARLYSASTLEIGPHATIDRHPFLEGLGPDILDPSLTAESVAARLNAPAFRARGLSGLLLDQGFLAGMGNYLRAEVLFEAGIAPHHRPRDLGDDARRRLAEALLAVPRRSYRCRGIEAARGMKSDYLADDADGFRFEVFGRDGEPCRRCGGMVVRAPSAGRRLYWCPGCQR